MLSYIDITISKRFTACNGSRVTKLKGYQSSFKTILNNFQAKKMHYRLSRINFRTK